MDLARPITKIIKIFISGELAKNGEGKGRKFFAREPSTKPRRPCPIERRAVPIGGTAAGWSDWIFSRIFDKASSSAVVKMLHHKTSGRF